MTAEMIAPLMVVAVLGAGLYRKTDIVKYFCEGAAEGLAAARDLCPILILLMTAVTMFTDSGAARTFSDFAAPLAERLGFPPECLPLVIMRPISGSGSLAVLDGILSSEPPESFAARTASVIMCSAETTVYMITVCYSSVGKKAPVSVFAASFAADITCFITAPLTVRLFLSR